MELGGLELTWARLATHQKSMAKDFAQGLRFTRRVHSTHPVMDPRSHICQKETKTRQRQYFGAKVGDVHLSSNLLVFSEEIIAQDTYSVQHTTKYSRIAYAMLILQRQYLRTGGDASSTTLCPHH